MYLVYQSDKSEMPSKDERRANLVFSIVVSILFLLGIILTSVGFGLYDDEVADCRHYKVSLATILDSVTYTTNCDNCLRLRIEYHTNEVGNVESYMIVRTRWAAGFASLQDANEIGDLITVYYDSDNPGSPYPERRICDPKGGFYVMTIMGIVLMGFAFVMLYTIFMAVYKNQQVVINRRPKHATRRPPNNGLRPIVIQTPKPKDRAPQVNYQVNSKPTTVNNGEYTQEYLLGDESTA